jgi:hypothetical protein
LPWPLCRYWCLDGWLGNQATQPHLRLVRQTHPSCIHLFTRSLSFFVVVW